ncbi:hypothetical protein Bbelb_123560 [Branchiostoma belcheri]|nr:hypothetical protein Bbelb_123560 [Branchiostoma belcheri]
MPATVRLASLPPCHAAKRLPSQPAAVPCRYPTLPDRQRATVPSSTQPEIADRSLLPCMCPAISSRRRRARHHATLDHAAVLLRPIVPARPAHAADECRRPEASVCSSF